MRRALLLLVLCFFLSACHIYAASAAADDSNENKAMPFTQQERLIILQRHNLVRSQVQPPAKSMPDLEWDTSLEKKAQDWAQSCVSDEAKYMITTNPDLTSDVSIMVGENIYASNGTIANLTNPVDAWASAKQYYKFEDNSCASGQNCGYYKQIIWASTLKIGCGRAYCANVKLGYTIVCDYGPPGNISPELKPYQPVGEEDPSTNPPSTTSPKPNPKNSTESLNGATNSRGCTGGHLLLVIVAIAYVVNLFASFI